MTTTLQQPRPSLRSQAIARSKRNEREVRKFFSAPTLLFLVIITQVPFALTLYYSFQNWNLLRPGNINWIGLRSFIEIALLMEVLFILNIFGEIFVMTTGGPGIDTTNLPFEIYKEGFLRWNVSRAAAFGVLAVILANMVVLLFLRVLRNQNSAPAK